MAIATTPLPPPNNRRKREARAARRRRRFLPPRPRRSRARLLRGLALLVAAALGAGLAPGAAPAPPASAQAVPYVDPIYGYTLEVPSGWWVEPPAADAEFGVTLLYNHNPELQERDPALGVVNPIKVQIGIGDLAPSASFADWLAARLLAGYNAERGISAASQPTPITLGAMSGQAVLLQGGTSPPVLELDFPIGAASAMSIGITPGNSPAIASALDVLATLGLPPELAPALPADPARPDNLANSTAALSALVAPSQPSLAAVQDQCSPGANSGAEAPNTPIEIWMPFHDGETWTVGGGGSFYGNYFHCNLYNDYYATDWNRPNDQGADVQPVADGVVAAVQGPPCPNTGYGCYVTVNHGGGVRTLYGHLSAVNVSVGQSVHRWDKIGSVGNSGNSTGAHLHLRFQSSVNGVYYSHCYNNNQTCPNGEAPRSPQSPRPSPMNSQSGPVVLQSGGSYTSNNRQPTAAACSAVSGEVVLYDLTDCQGESAEADGVGLWTMVDYFNDRAESLAVPAGWSVRLFLDNSTDSPGVCIPVTAADLRAYQYSNGRTAENSATWMEVFDMADCGGARPDLTPFPLPSRSAPVIAAATAGTDSNSALIAGQTVYMDWGLKNIGQTSAGPFYVDLYIDGQRYIHYPFPGLDPGQSTGFPDWAENWPVAGWHTIMVIVDADSTVSETDEGNNVWTGQFFWQPNHPIYVPLVIR